TLLLLRPLRQGDFLFRARRQPFRASNLLPAPRYWNESRKRRGSGEVRRPLPRPGRASMHYETQQIASHLERIADSLETACALLEALLEQRREPCSNEDYPRLYEPEPDTAS